MFSFLGELMELVVWLVQRVCWFVRSALGCPPMGLDPWTIGSFRTFGSRNSSWPTGPMFANGPWDWRAYVADDPVWPKELVTVCIPSRRSIRR